MKVHLVLKDIEGERLDSSVEKSLENKGEPLKMVVGKSKNIQCLNEGLIGLKVGEEADLICPPDYAFGEKGHV